MADPTKSRRTSVDTDCTLESSVSSLSETSVVLGGRRVSFSEFCEEGEEEDGVGGLEDLRRETVTGILQAGNHYHVLGLRFRDRRDSGFEEKIQRAYLEKSLIVHPAEW